MSHKIFFRSDLELKDVSVLYNDKQNDTNVELWASDIGSTIFIYMHNNNYEKGIMIDNNYLIKFKLYNNKFYPTIDLVFRDPNSIIGNKFHPDDNTIVSIYKKSNSKLLMPIRMDLVITNFRMVKEKEYGYDIIYNIKAKMNFNNITENASYKGTSFSVLQQLSKKCKLGFASNIEDTNDEMVWINPGNYTSEFIPDIAKNSYRNDNGFLLTFIDQYYNLNYVDVEEQLNQDTSKNRSIFSTKMFKKDGTEQISKLLLTNHPNLLGSNMHIDKFVVDNSARSVNWNIGYDSTIYYYNKSNDTVLNKDLETITKKPNENINIFKSLEKSENIRKYYMGKLDTDNVHENYLYSRKQNENNMEFLQKVKMNIILKMPNMSLYRLQLIELVIYELETLVSDMGTQKNKTDSYRINDKLSGSWLITGINYIYDGKESTQEITLVKRELNINYDKNKLDDLTKAFYNYKK